jgi:hypothetical protein
MMQPFQGSNPGVFVGVLHQQIRAFRALAAKILCV